jgi:hypothetical protein
MGHKASTFGAAPSARRISWPSVRHVSDSRSLLTTLEHYLSVGLGRRETGLGAYQRAYELAVSNVHAPVQRALEDIGPVTVVTDENIGDISCIYEVDGPNSAAALVFISTVLPYSAVILTEGRRYSRFVSMGETNEWARAVVDCLTERGFFVLPDDACRAKRPAPSGPGGSTPSYFEDLFEDEFGPPEDWFWVGDPEPANETRNCP